MMMESKTSLMRTPYVRRTQIYSYYITLTERVRAKESRREKKKQKKLQPMNDEWLIHVCAKWDL